MPPVGPTLKVADAIPCWLVWADIGLMEAPESVTLNGLTGHRAVVFVDQNCCHRSFAIWVNEREASGNEDSLWLDASNFERFAQDVALVVNAVLVDINNWVVNARS
jgi:hypothetical protein